MTSFFKHLLLLLFTLQLSAQQKFTISGYLKDVKNGESLIGATVSKAGSNIGAAANEYGFYSLTLPEGENTILVSMLGYATRTLQINLTKSQTMNFELSDASTELEEVVISGEAADRNVKSVEMSVARL